ncbi:MAG: hypothetical protein ACRYG8_16865 [Janthinobacterium lividum]
MLSEKLFSPVCQVEGADSIGFGDEVEDELALAFPGCAFTYVLTIISHDPLKTTIAILSLLDTAGAQLTGLRVVRVDKRFEHRIRVSGLRPREARNLSGRVSFLPSVACALVEHHIMRAA